MESMHIKNKEFNLLVGRHAKAKKRFLLVLLIIFVVTSSCFCLEKVPIIKVEADVAIVDEKPEIKDIEVNQSYVNPLQSPGEANIGFPSVEVWAITNNRQINRAVKEYVGEGKYNFIVGFPPGGGPKDGDFIEVVVKVVDERGKTIAKGRHMMIWGGVNVTDNATWNLTQNNSSSSV